MEDPEKEEEVVGITRNKFPKKSVDTDMNIGKKKLIIFSSSITKGIDERRFRRSYTSGSMRIQKFHGARAVHFLDYLPTHLFREKPDTVVLQCGGNDLPTSRKQPVDYGVSD